MQVKDLIFYQVATDKKYKVGDKLLFENEPNRQALNFLNLSFNQDDDKGIFDAGFKDDKPEGFADDRSLISKQVDAEFGKDIKLI